MKKILAILVLVVTPGCSFLTAPVSYENRTEAAQILAQQEEVKQELRELRGELTSNPSDIDAQKRYLEALRKKDELDAALTKLEEKILRDKFGPLVGTLTMLPGVGPFVPELGALLMALLPLLGKRGRKHYKNALKELNPFVGNKVSPLKAADSIVKALGIKHTEA